MGNVLDCSTAVEILPNSSHRIGTCSARTDHPGRTSNGILDSYARERGPPDGLKDLVVSARLLQANEWDLQPEPRDS